MIDNDKIGQTSAKFDNVIDNIFKVVCGIIAHKGNKFIFSTYDPAQLQTIRGRPLLVSPCDIPCYKIILLNNLVRTQDDNFSGFNRLIEKNHKELIDNSQMIDEFEQLW